MNIMTISTPEWALSRLFFLPVISHIILNGDKQDSSDGANSIREEAIVFLCDMNPTEMANVRNICVEYCKLPSLVIRLTIKIHNLCREGTGFLMEDNDDIISFMSGLLLGPDPQIRSWISFYIRKSGQKHKNEPFSIYRQLLTEKLRSFAAKLTASGKDASMNSVLVRASSLLRLFTALRGIAGMK